MNRTARTLALALACGVPVSHAAGRCGISAGPIVFPPYQTVSARSAMATDRTSDTQIIITCSAIARGGPYWLRILPDGAGSGPTRTLRHTAGTSAPMRVLLYQDAGYTAPWGEGGTAITGVLPPGNSRHMHYVFGRIPAMQPGLRAGAYHASFTVALDYSP